MGNDQTRQVVDIVNNVLGVHVRGMYLFGSAVVGGLMPRSDLDVMVVSTRRITDDERRNLIRQLLDISQKPRNLEVTLVVETEIRPWRYPPRMDFQYGDWLREEFERGEAQPWPEVNPDLATLIHMVLIANTSLQGPPPAQLFDPIPRRDLVAATVDGIDVLLHDLDGDARNVALTLARMWSSIVTEELVSKDAAAKWALARLPDRHQELLAEARAIYVGDQPEESKDFVSRARDYANHVVGQIHEHLRPRGS